MLTVICFGLLFTFSYGHTNIVQSEAELQSALMPQELNPAFVPEKGDQWNAVMPLQRSRRDTQLAEPVVAVSPVGEYVKHYGRVVAFIVLVVSAVSEIVLYYKLVRVHCFRYKMARPRLGSSHEVSQSNNEVAITGPGSGGSPGADMGPNHRRSGLH